MNRYLRLGDEVADAVVHGRPLVALESTIISHGMPHPRNVETAIATEGIVRERGATPATIAVIDGMLRVGLSEDELDRLGSSGSGVAKVSRRDLPFVVRAGTLGATTVAATMIVAAMAGIRLFATGGIGGVHRGASRTFDVSADLRELASTPVTVVCAGVKSILDIGATLEYLETLGVPVVGFGTDVLPAFFTRESPFHLPHRLDRTDEVAALIRLRDDLGLGGGMVVANPVPAESSMDPAVVENAIEQALADLEADGIAGQEATPYLLARVSQLTGTDSLDSNVALIRSNARLAADVAVALGT